MLARQAFYQPGHFLRSLHDGEICSVRREKKTASGSLERLSEVLDPAAGLVPATGSCGVISGLASGVSASGGHRREKRRKRGDTSRNPRGLRERRPGWDECEGKKRGLSQVGLELAENATAMGTVTSLRLGWTRSLLIEGHAACRGRRAGSRQRSFHAKKHCFNGCWTRKNPLALVQQMSWDKAEFGQRWASPFSVHPLPFFWLHL